MRSWIALIATIVLVPPTPSAAQHIRDGNGFLSNCEAPKDFGRVGCLAYVIGMHDMAGFLWQSGRVIPEVCPPESVTMTQYSDILVKYLKDNPEQRHKPTGELFWIAASMAYPCSRR